MRKHGADKRRVWCKVHLVIDADSHEVRAVEMTDHPQGDGEILPGLLAQLPKAERIGVISGDGAYDNRHRGITVAPTDPDDLREIAELRTMLEAHALQLSIPQLTAADIDEAAALLDEADAAPDDPIGQSDLHWRFHRALMRRAARPRVIAQIESLHVAVSRYLLPAWIAAGLSVGWVASHRKLLSLARRGRGEEAAELNARQVEEARERVAAWLAEQESP